MGKIRIIIEERGDAIGLCNRNLCMELLKLDRDLFEVTKIGGGVGRYVKGLLKLLCKISPNDVLLFTDPKSIKANLALFLKNKKYVVVHHLDKEPLYYQIIPFWGIKNLIDCFDGVICDSRFTRGQLVFRGVSKVKLRVVHEGIDPKLFRPRGRKRGLPKDYLLSVGTELPRKNMRGVLEALSGLKNEFPDLKLIKLGRAREGDREKTLRIIDELDLKDRVIFSGYVEDEELPRYYSGAKMLLLPSFLEGFGLPILEAMACKCPVVTSDRGSMKELCGGTQMLVDPNNSDDIVDKCRDLLVNNKKRDKQINRGLERVKDFSWAKTARGVYTFLNSGVN